MMLFWLTYILFTYIFTQYDLYIINKHCLPFIHFSILCLFLHYYMPTSDAQFYIFSKTLFSLSLFQIIKKKLFFFIF